VHHASVLSQSGPRPQSPIVWNLWSKAVQDRHFSSPARGAVHVRQSRGLGCIRKRISRPPGAVQDCKFFRTLSAAFSLCGPRSHNEHIIGMAVHDRDGQKEIHSAVSSCEGQLHLFYEAKNLAINFEQWANNTTWRVIQSSLPALTVAPWSMVGEAIAVNAETSSFSNLPYHKIVDPPLMSDHRAGQTMTRPPGTRITWAGGFPFRPHLRRHVGSRTAPREKSTQVGRCPARCSTVPSMAVTPPPYSFSVLASGV
jgi:hypothetical protein